VLAPNAAAPHFFDPEPLSDERLLSLGLRKPFLLAVGTIEPRKNLTALFDAHGISAIRSSARVVGDPVGEPGDSGPNRGPENQRAGRASGFVPMRRSHV